MSNPKEIYGIDLGTTYSCIARVDKFDQPVVLDNFDGQTTTPSVVYFEDENTPIVGSEAKGMLAIEPNKTISFIKREIGVDESYVKPTQFPHGLDPTEISALILKKLVKDANDASDSPDDILDVVITCPAYFGTKERLQTKQAGVLAGLNVLAIIDEPVAAAIAYGVRVEEEKYILVYDLGGGTFDVTLIRVKGGVIKVIATGGNHHLGGVDWDTTLAEHMLHCFNSEHSTNYDFESTPELKNALLLEAEQKKKTLSGKSKVIANVSYEGKSSRVEITRELFNELTAELLDETISETQKILEISRSKGFERVDEILLVGGSSSMPQVKEKVDESFGSDARLSDPHQCVAKGAAVFAMNEKFKEAVAEYENDETGEVTKPEAITQRTNIVTVTSKTFGTDCTIDGQPKVQNLIFANTSLPVKIVETFRTTRDDQRSISMKVFESNVTDPEKHSLIEETQAKLLDDKALEITTSHPARTPIEVTFAIDNEGILDVTAVVGNDRLNYTLKITGVKSIEELSESKAMIDKMRLE